MIENKIFPNLELPKFIVATRCITFNHASYILDALHGFVMQETNFPFLTVVIDDASTDGEQKVIEKYMKEEFSIGSNNCAECWENELSRFIYARHPQNQNCYFVVILLKRNLYRDFAKKKALYSPWINSCKYLAECEGDDYWTDPNKLQIQVDFLDNHPDYSMCFHNAIEHWEKGEKEDNVFSHVEERDYSGQEIYKDWIVPTASVVMKRDVYKTETYLKAIKNPYFIYGDIITFLSCAAYGTLRGMKRCMSVYRRHEGGMVFSPLNTEQLLKRSEHHRHIEKVFGNAYKAVSMEKYTSDALLSVSRLRSENKPFILQLFKVFYFQPVKTIKYVFRNVALFR